MKAVETKPFSYCTHVLTIRIGISGVENPIIVLIKIAIFYYRYKNYRPDYKEYKVKLEYLFYGRRHFQAVNRTDVNII